MKKSLVYLIPSLLLLSMPWTSQPAAATTYVRVADGDLADQAAVIAEVRVLAVEPAPAGRPMTDYQVEVQDLIAGYLPGSAIVVRVLGGRAAVDTELVVPGAPRFTEGQSALLFLVPRNDGTFDILHLMLGAFHVLELDGKRVVYRDLSEATEIPRAGTKPPEPEQPRDLERFGAWLRDRLGGVERPADYRLEIPAGGLPIPEKFSLLGGRWTVFDSGGSVRWRAHNSGLPGQPGGGFSEFQTALRAWNNHPHTPIRFTYGGTTSVSAPRNTCDGNNVLLFDDPNNDITSPYSCTQGGVLGIARYCRRVGVQTTYNGMRFDIITEADIVTNNGTACAYPGRKKAEELFSHELGHGLGLGHSSNSGAQMWPYIHNDGRGARLHNDDKNGIIKLYGSPPTPATNLQAQTQTGGIRLTWRDNSNDELRFEIQRRRGSGSYSHLLNAGANTTSWLDTGGASGTAYTYRVRAFNSAGTSAWTNEATATTPGTPAPSNLAATATSGSEIELTWVDNSGTETGFQIESRTGGGPFTQIATAPANSRSAVIGALTSETTYGFRVRATAAAGPSAYSNTASATTWGDPCVCAPGPATMCLEGGRFRVEADWRDPQGQTGDANVVDFGSNNSGLFWFFSPNNWEMLLKVLDGCANNGHFWVFAAATTNVEYDLNVTDCWTGAPANYFNPLGRTAPALTDTRALATCSATPPPGAVAPAARTAPPATAREAPDKGGCVPSDTDLCVVNSRFQVEVDWEDHQGNLGSGQVVPTDSANSGLLWFFNADNWEMLIKVLDGCAINGHYWVFSAATTDVGYTLRVTDTDNGTVWETTNALGTAAPTVTDTAAFATCP